MVVKCSAAEDIDSGTLGTYVSDEHLLKESSSAAGSPVLRSIQRLTSEASGNLARTASRAASAAQQQLVKALSGVPGVGPALGAALSRGGSYSYVPGEDMEAIGGDSGNMETWGRHEGLRIGQGQEKEAELSPMHSRHKKKVSPQQQYYESRLGTKLAGTGRRAEPGSNNGAAGAEIKHQQQQLDFSPRATPGLTDGQGHERASSPAAGQIQPNFLATSLAPAVKFGPGIATVPLETYVKAEEGFGLRQASAEDLIAQGHASSLVSGVSRGQQPSGKSPSVALAKPNLQLLQLPASMTVHLTSKHIDGGHDSIDHLQQHPKSWQSLGAMLPPEAHGWLPQKPEGLAGLRVPSRHHAAAADRAGEPLDLGLPVMPKLQLPTQQRAVTEAATAPQDVSMPTLSQLRLPVQQVAAPPAIPVAGMADLRGATGVTGLADLSLPSMPQLRVRTVAEKPPEVVGLLPFQLYSQALPEAGMQGHVSRGPLLDPKSAAAAKAPRNSEAGIAHRRRVKKAAAGGLGASGFVGTPDYGNR
jgi:hypothetical protein